MELNSLHLMLTYECTLECEHCFAWGSPWQRGTMTLAHVAQILNEAASLGSVTSIYFEGGEPFLYYVTLVRAVEMAAARDFEVGIVSNAYWATSAEDAREWLRPFAGRVADLSLSNDRFHWSEKLERQVAHARQAAAALGIPVGEISIAQPEATEAAAALGQLPPGESAVMFRGRAAEKLAPLVPGRPWETLTSCPYEDLRDPGRVHVDPLGHVHICQGISLGNLFVTSLQEICARYDADAHLITGPLLAGGPAELVRRYKLPHTERYADACHLCYTARSALRHRFPDVLVPDQMYAVMS